MKGGHVFSDEFLEDLIANPEEALLDADNEDREAMNMKLQRDLGDREEELYERMIGSKRMLYLTYISL